MAKIGIAVPTYNEKENILTLIKGISKALINDPNQFLILVIDDNSPDGTAAVVLEEIKSFKSANIELKLLFREKKEGLGKAYIAGFRELIIQDCNYIIQMDADYSHNPSYLSQFSKYSNSYDFIVGSRYVLNGKLDDNWPLHRKLQSVLGNKVAKIVLGINLNDITGGYNLYSSNLLKKIEYELITQSGYGFQIELKFRAYKTVKSFIEIPIIFIDRINGVSKIPTNTILTNLILCFKLRLRIN